MNKVFDYLDYVELGCEESDGSYESWPTAHDVARSSSRFIPPNEPGEATPYNRGKIAQLWSDFQSSRFRLFGAWHHVAACPYCKEDLEPMMPLPTPGPSFKSIDLRECRQCGWWDVEETCPLKWYGKTYSSMSIHRRAVLREFSVAGSEVPVLSLRRALHQQPEILNRVNPTKLEHLVAEIFSEFMDCEAIHVGGPRDGGIDIILVNGNRRYALQVKRRGNPRRAESVQVIREFVGAMVLSGEVKGLFITTAPRYSQHALDAASTATNVGPINYLELCDASKLLDVNRKMASNIPAPWVPPLTPSDEASARLRPGQYSDFILPQPVG